MSRKIIGVTVGSPLPKPNLMQTDPAKGDYVKGKEEFLEQINIPGSGGNVDQSGGSGLSNTAKELLINILRNAVYSTDQSGNIALLEAELQSESGGGESETTYYNISWSGAFYTKGNNTMKIAEGGTFTSTIAAEDGYSIESVSVTMGGVSVAGAFTDGVVTVENVTGDIAISVTTKMESGELVYSITNNLTNCKNSNSASVIQHGMAYNATITANDGYFLDKVVVTMGGEAVVVTGGVIRIDSVTGDIVITGTASTYGFDTAYNLPYQLGGEYNSANGTKVNNSTSGRVESLVAIPDGCDFMRFTAETLSGYSVAFYDADKEYVDGGWGNGTTMHLLHIPDGAVYVGLSIKGIGNSPYIVVYFHKYIAVKWSDEPTGKLSDSGVLTTGVTDSYYSTENIPIPDGASVLYLTNKAGTTFTWKKISVYSENGTHLKTKSASASGVVVTHDTLNGAAYALVCAYPTAETDNDPANQLIFYWR